jgi:hypothetical protein
VRGQVVTAGVATIAGHECALAPPEFVLGECELVMDKAWKRSPVRRPLASPARLNGLSAGPRSRCTRGSVRAGLSCTDFILLDDGSGFALESNTNIARAPGERSGTPPRPDRQRSAMSSRGTWRSWAGSPST